jgi:hypothetical protein
MTDTTTENSAPSRAEVAKDEAVDHVQDLTETTAQHASEMKDEAKGQALNVARDVRRELESQGDAQAKRASSALRDVGSQLHAMAERGQPGAVTDVTRHLADRSHQLASRLDQGGLQGVSDDLRGFARRQPGLFLAAAGVAGFVAARVLRNNTSREQGSGIGQPGSQFAPPEQAMNAGASRTGTPAMGALP